MKRLLTIILVVALLLTGCAADNETTGATETTVPTEPEPTGLYFPDSDAEKLSGGAVRAYPLGVDDYIAIVPMGSRLLLVSYNGEMTVLVDDICEPVATAATKAVYARDGVGFDAAQTGVAYFVADTHEVILLNPQLQESGRYQLPTDMQGRPVIDVAKNVIYYCVGSELLVLDMQTNIQRKLRVQDADTMELTGSFFDGNVLRVNLLSVNKTLYLSAQTGQVLSEEQNIFTLDTAGDFYYLERFDGYMQQRIVGTIADTPLSVQYPDGTELTGSALSAFLPEGAYDYATGVLQRNGILSYQFAEDGYRFSFHDLAQGMTTAQMQLPEIEAPVTMAADQQYVWIIAAPIATNLQVLYRWDTTKSAAEEEIFSLYTLYTAQNPDTDGLKLQQEHVDSYNEQHGVRIAIWENAVKNTGEFTVVAEHQPAVISDMLTRLEPVFTLFPNNFLRYTVRNGWIRVCLVRSISGGNTWAQFWHDGDCYILITPDADIQEAFLRGVSYAIDTNVLGNSRDFDTWNNLNPENFSYDYSYDLYANREDLSLTEGEKRAFIDSFSMTYPHEDRCRVFYYAMTSGNEAIFTSKFMQNKLQKLCEGIREAYGLEKKDAAYVWEQYLTQEMDYSYT